MPSKRVNNILYKKFILITLYVVHWRQAMVMRM